MIVVRDQQLRLLALAQLIRELQEAARNKTPPPAGFSDQQVEELSTLSSAELVRLSEMTEPRVAIQIDAGSLEHGLRQVDYLNKRSRQLEFFITHGATPWLDGKHTVFGVVVDAADKAAVDKIGNGDRIESITVKLA